MVPRKPGLVLLCLVSLTSSLDPLPSYYHSTSQIRSTLSSWASPSLRLLPTVSIDAVDILSFPFPRAFIVCGEHPRELITTETCLEFVRRAKDMDLGSMRVVVNANPEARQEVEAGRYCLRTNLRGVDINRNWDAHWQPGDCLNHPAECPGHEPMSEPQDLELRSLLLDFDPDIVVLVHSGGDEILTPYAYDFTPPPATAEAMISLLKEVSSAHTKSPVGPASLLLHYTCPGNLLDYSFENTKASVTCVFEAYVGEAGVKSFLGQDGEQNECFHHFNPDSEEKYQEVVGKWTDTLIDLIGRV